LIKHFTLSKIIIGGIKVNIVIIGLPASGKSEIGILLAQKLNWTFIDIDEEMLTENNRKGRKFYSIQELYRKIGKSKFSDLEQEIILNSKYLDMNVIATGGGTLLNDKNGDILKKNGFFIWLNVPVTKIIKRLEEQAPRPIFSNQNLTLGVEIMAQLRNKIYASWANLEISGSNSRQIIVKEILEKIKNVPQLKYKKII